MLKVNLDCTGCYACANICPQNCILMKNFGDGFVFPVIDNEKCIQCNQCENVCPILNEPKKSLHTCAFAVKNKNEIQRQNSTSGGIFSLFAEQILDANGIVFGAAYDNNFKVKHISITDRNMLPILQGTKYVQSTIGTSYIEVKKNLEIGRQVLFSGTPCQCAGLKLFLGNEYDNLLTIDIICHGIPSPKIWQAYIDYRSKMENKGIRPLKVNMRSKVSGWSHYGYSTEFDYGNGKISFIHNNQDLFMKAFISNICLRSSCSNCKAKGIERCTDFTLGDYWGVWNQHPEFDDNKGTSILFVHSNKGWDILKWLNDKIDCIEINIEDASRENESLVNSVQAHPGREEFLKQVTAENFDSLINKYFLQKSVQKIGLVNKIKRKLICIFD